MLYLLLYNVPHCLDDYWTAILADAILFVASEVAAYTYLKLSFPDKQIFWSEMKLYCMLRDTALPRDLWQIRAEQMGNRS
jgi:hypothetical protein